VESHISNKGMRVNSKGTSTLISQRIADPAVRLSKRRGNVPNMSGSIHWPVTRLAGYIDIYVAGVGFHVFVSLYRAKCYVTGRKTKINVGLNGYLEINIDGPVPRSLERELGIRTFHLESRLDFVDKIGVIGVHRVSDGNLRVLRG
jgi:hypothetical protein